MKIKEDFTPSVKLTDENRWIYIKHEKAKAICRLCGLVDHEEYDYSIPYPVSEVSGEHSE